MKLFKCRVFKLLKIQMINGTVKWYNATKGYGFIATDGKDIFIHSSALESAGIKTLRDGQKVSFEVQSNKGKESAVNIKLV